MKRGVQGAALAVLLGTSVAAPARGYCRARACDDLNPAYSCEYDLFGCPITESRPLLFWPSACVTVAVHGLGSPRLGISFETVDSATNLAFGTWLSAECEGGEHPGFRVENLGDVACGEPEYNVTGNANVVLFKDKEWFPEPERTIAITLLQFDTITGEIFDADIIINEDNLPPARPGSDHAFALTDVLTHEVGHFLGLAHSREADSILWPAYAERRVGEPMLNPDDVAGICSVFPPETDTQEAVCSPRHGFAGECGGRPVRLSGGCSMAPRSESRFGVAALLVLAAAGCLRRRGR
ncbi:MAG TPA: matrixin family metalloprotease [Polyangiaceae bacterium]|nr:matrixin family metalloprotease [Polyangiaceae bacterium]